MQPAHSDDYSGMAPSDDGRSGSYRMEDLDAPAEIARLEAQVRLAEPIEHPFLREAGLRPTDHLLDVGCGPGFFSLRAAELLVPEGRVTGVDVDPSLVEIARARLAGPDTGALADRVDLRVGTAIRLPMPDDSVDFSYARFLFQHLEQPQAVLAEMVRVTRPGGTVAVVDTDDGSLVMVPEPPGFPRLLTACAAAQRARGGNRHVGRDLKALLVGAGLESSRMTVRPFTSEDVGAEAFVGIAVGFKSEIVGPPFMRPDDLEAIEAGIAAAMKDPGFFGHALGYAGWGRVAEKRRAAA